MDKAVLEALCEVTTVYFRDMFALNLSLVPEESYKMSPKPAFATEELAYIGLAGEEYQGQLVIGFSNSFPKRASKRFLNDLKVEEVTEFCHSAMCEMLNGISGNLAQHSLIFSQYGELSQTLPVLLDTKEAGSVYFMRSEGGTLKYCCEYETLYVYFSMKKFVSRQIKIPDDPSLNIL